MDSAQAGAFFGRFKTYFDRPVAAQAARTLADGIEIELRIQGSDGNRFETLVFGRSGGANTLRSGESARPQLVFSMTPLAADEILTHTSDDIGMTGVQILKLMFSADANRRVRGQVNAKFMDLWGMGYFGVLAAGGTEFAKLLAAKGLDGMTAIRAALRKRE